MLFTQLKLFEPIWSTNVEKVDCVVPKKMKFVSYFIPSQGAQFFKFKGFSTLEKKKYLTYDRGSIDSIFKACTLSILFVVYLHLTLSTFCCQTAGIAKITVFLALLDWSDRQTDEGLKQ